MSANLRNKRAAFAPSAEIIGANIVVDSFLRHRTKHVFVFPGGTIGPILNVIEKQTGIEIICPRTEQGAGYAAIGYAKITGRPAVFMVTSGPGVTNAVTPIADAYYDNVPLVVITGQVAVGEMRGELPVKQRGFQEVDTIGLMKPITKAAFLVKNICDLPAIMEKAFILAGSGRHGPVVIDLPMNVQRQVYALGKSTAFEPQSEVPTAPRAKIDALTEWIAKAERPVILAGGGVVASGASEELRALADFCHIPVAMSLPAMGAYPSLEPLSLGLCGYAGSQYANLAIFHADLLIGIGTTFHVRQTGSLPARIAEKAKIARIDLDRNELQHSRVPLDLEIEADAREALRDLNASVRQIANGVPGRTANWLETIAGWKKDFPVGIGAQSALPKPQHVIEIIDKYATSTPLIVTTGVGQHQIWVARHFSFALPARQLLTSSGHGTMGFDLPVAIGAKIANPDATVICFVGDGSLQMNIQELATVAERKLDIKIVVLDNHALNIVAQFQRHNWKSHPSTGDKYNPNFVRIAEAYGIESVSIRSDGLEAQLRSAIRRSGPILIYCDVDPREDLLPMLLGGHTLDDMSNEWSF